VPRYLIERDLPGAGALTDEQVADIAATSNAVLAGMSGRAQWVESYVTGDAITCVYVADSPESVREHAAAGGFPVTEVREVRRVIDPTSADLVRS
jgi:hypothetical protein